MSWDHAGPDTWGQYQGESGNTGASWNTDGWQQDNNGGTAWPSSEAPSSEERRCCQGVAYTYTEYMSWAVEYFGGSEKDAQEYWSWKMKPADPVDEKSAAPAATYQSYDEPTQVEEKRYCPSDRGEYTLQEYLSWACEPDMFGSEADAMKYWNEKMTPVDGNAKGNSSWSKNDGNATGGNWSSSSWDDGGGNDSTARDAGGWGDWGADPSSWATNLETIDWQGACLVQVVKDFYEEHPTVQHRTPAQVDEIRRSKSIEVIDQTGRPIPNPVTTFEEAAFPDWILEKFHLKAFQDPTPIQIQTWPVALQGRDLIGIAETGSGKTLAYLLPMMVHIMAQAELQEGEGPVGVVLAPTRELALQITEVCWEYVGGGMKCCCVYGGGSVKEQGYALQAKNDIVVATPGRFIQMLNDRWTNLNRVTYVVLDEADEMLQRGFGEQVKLILGQIRPDRQVLMFSATWGKEVQALSIEHCKVEPVTVKVGGDRLAACQNINQNVLIVEDKDKNGKLYEAIYRAKVHLPNSPTKMLIFCRTKLNADLVGEYLWSKNITAGVMHSDKDQNERMRALAEFKDGNTTIMAATGCLGRGHDIPKVKYVINYDAPDAIESYIHRIGRTGRAGEQGYAMTFLTSKDAKLAAPLIEVLAASGREASAGLKELAQSCQERSWTTNWDETAEDWQAAATPQPHTLQDHWAPEVTGVADSHDQAVEYNVQHQ